MSATETSPITEAYSWIAEREFSATRPLIDVAQAVPGYAPAESLTNHLAEVVGEADLSRYGPVMGVPALRKALALDISRAYGANIADSHVAITAGCNQAFSLAAMAVCEPGDEFILPIPYYFNHDMWLHMSGVRARYLECDSDMLPAVEDAHRLINDRTKAILLVTPNNPTGRIYPPDLIRDFADFAAHHGIRLFLDETYRDFRTSTEPAHELFSDPNWAETVVHLHSFSKVFSITGYRVGGLVADPTLLTEIDKIADCLTICPSRLGQEAALFGLENLGAWVEQNRVMMNDRVTTFTTEMANADIGLEIAAAGAYFAYVRHSLTESSRSVAKRLAESESVLALAGSMFGPGQDNALRLAFANLDDSAIPELAGRLANFFG